MIGPIFVFDQRPKKSLKISLSLVLLYPNNENGQKFRQN
nr:MAG TPA: hypothetical protein [Bacteriophage sp.]DAX27617.1 MAG TPA: hypothetical protein [Caudoviricetes sp.]